MRPKTKVSKFQIGEACKIPKCRGKLNQISCLAVCYHSQVVRGGEVYLLWDQVGRHEHPRPPGGALSEQEKHEVQEQVFCNQSATPQQLWAGDTDVGSIPLSQIAPKLANARSARYHVSQAKAELGIAPTSPSKSISKAIYLYIEWILIHCLL